ncbi:MAG: asparagine synthase (glutamine-hydrolyzing) [Cryomorphaceae bacterium]|nr:asparagine synthase (glutamine-hydrolyzing) [Cryomorphaceae bacterium]
MCGIAGCFHSGNAQIDQPVIQRATERIKHRGPDAFGFFQDEHIALGHRRLSILDISEKGAQPMIDRSGNYVIVFNGEIFNYRELRNTYFPSDHPWRSDSDTELLLDLYLTKGPEALNLLRGFFAFALYSKSDCSLFLARDRFGKKPLYYHEGENGMFSFASELGALMEFGVNRSIDKSSMAQYFHFNYIPEPYSIYQEVHKLPAGHFMEVKKSSSTIHCYYQLPSCNVEVDTNYHSAQQKLKYLLDEAVQERMISDVPLGAFLSGGIDSSVVVALASRYHSNLKTYSIGYTDNPFFDETRYAESVAKKFGTDHSVFRLSTSDIEEQIDSVLNSLSEPFADFSAIPLHILSQKTKAHVTVALSGDGGEELVAGYNKHKAEYALRQQARLRPLAKLLNPAFRLLPSSRNSCTANKFRQLQKYVGGLTLSPADRYWSWAGILSDEEVFQLATLTDPEYQEYDVRRRNILKSYRRTDNMSDYLRTDIQLVLQSDMLVKVDRMSMAHGLEVRSPFLDHRIVEFALSLPDRYRISGTMGKRIVQDAFKNILPAEIYNRPKKGFEVPLLSWFRGSWKNRIENDYLSDDFIKEQGLFDVESIQRIRRKLFSVDPGDSVATTWALIVFQHWWKRQKD